MTALRSKCDNKERCGKTGHYRTNMGWVRCPCLRLEMVKTRLGTMFDEKPQLETRLLGKRDSNLRIEGPLLSMRPHIAGALIKQIDERKTFVVLDAYRMIEIFLEKDDEHATNRVTVDTDLLVLLLGFGDPRNRYLPELLVQCLKRRELERKPTWVMMGVDISHVAGKYNADVYEVLKQYQVVGK